MISHLEKADVEQVTPERRELEDMSPSQWIPQKRGRPRKNKETGETQALSKPHVRSIAEKILMRAIQLEPIEDICWESMGRMRGMDAMGANVRGLTQQLEQAQISLAELYQENKELR
jgi:hypothetical protein